MVRLVGFADASEKAYGAVIYAVSTDSSGRTASKLVCSKSRLAPMKTVTIPRLELCAAVLLAKLMQKIRRPLEISPGETSYYTDSTIVLDAEVPI
ncbi:hypothetical protein JTE90_027802 [Oedothorax gibbosus]|uniref:Reverse transcriptase/retrotransposon-derived protein RNase H-like domain-containing protein n=1 Tax=Oedothorax gibbosus TaxID=931172 RepID=A0AAV6V606_9ARAC|nr:hypothetical protein JTE90_027802 [Oedothorax gibbosus]